MKLTTGKMDPYNRVALPAAVRDLGWTQDTRLEIHLTEENTVVILPQAPQCRICRREGELVRVGAERLCRFCMENVAAAMGDLEHGEWTRRSAPHSEGDGRTG